MPLIFIPPVIVPAAIFIPADVQVFALVIFFVSYPSLPPSSFTPERRGVLTCINYYCTIDFFSTVILLQGGGFATTPLRSPALCLSRRQRLTLQSFHAFLLE
jgi:hypothetical protein